MAEKATIARPYARAAFEHVRDGGGAFAAWSALLDAGAAVAATSGAHELFGNPHVALPELVELIAGIAAGSGATVGADGRNFLAVLAHNRRLAFLPEIATQFRALRAAAENTLEVEVTSAMKLDSEQRERLQRALETRFARQVRIAETLDAALIGGAIVRADDLVIDGSLRGRLARLEQQISRP
jgi:F-type H+-transporting ATPase subunit delta